MIVKNSVVPVINMDTEANDNVTTTDLEGQNGTNIIILTLKERCYLLQQRLKSVEQENIQLALQCSKSTSNNISQDVNVLNENIAQLTKEKSQLAHHVFMVACENKKLWSRLVNFSKSNSQYENSESANKKSALKNDLSPTKDSNFTIPHLIRSQTFTTAPNPKLKARIEESGDNIEASLEEISLKVINSFLAEKSELVQQYEQMVELQMTNDKDFNYKSLGFAYLDDLNCDSLADIKQNTEKLVDLKKQAFQQQIELRSIISRLESINHKPEDGPATFNHNKPAEAFKLGSKSECQDTSETENLDSSTRWVTPANSTSYQDNMEDASAFSNNTSKISHNNVQATINNNNKNADVSNSLLSAKLKEIKINQERTCPLCGERFNASVAFETFSQHVEEHFVGDEDYDSVVENFEILNASIGNNFN